jgi:TetR/AcrR family transcriptional regulator, cholesterol catabolism regulator
MSEIAKRRAAAAAGAKNNPAYREKQDAIRKAAGRVFHQRGFHATKLNDVAEEAGVDRASLYYYVGSKEQLFQDVVAEAVTANIEATQKIAAEDIPAPEKLAKIIHQLMVSFETYYPYMYVFVQEDFVKLKDKSSVDNEWMAGVLEWNSTYFKLVRGVINEGIQRGELQTPLPAGIVANCLIGMLNYSNLWFQPDGLLDAEEIARGMTTILLNGMIVDR